LVATLPAGQHFEIFAPQRPKIHIPFQLMILSFTFANPLKNRGFLRGSVPLRRGGGGRLQRRLEPGAGAPP